MKEVKSGKLVLLVLLCGGLTWASGVRWDYMWDANELPEEFLSGMVFLDSAYIPDDDPGAFVDRYVNNKIYTCITSASANAYYRTQEGVFGDESGLLEDSTIEIRFNNDYAENMTSNYYTNTLFIKQESVGHLGFKFAWNHGCNPWEVNMYAGIYRDFFGWSTVRVLVRTENGLMTHADLYYLNDQDNWVYGNTSFLTPSATTNATEFLFGDIGGNWGGKWDEDYLYFTTQGATLGEIYSPEINIADLNGDGVVDLLDLLIMASEWLK